ncbi:MAG: MFS transporter [Chitinivibrionia bacterium]|nr:MFS transporter [Chitinivibrionia bacterium]
MNFNWKKNAALFLIGQALSLFGTMVVQYAILWHVVLKSQSGTTMTVFTIIVLLPMVFISPFAGVWADRFNKKIIINISDGAVALFSLIVAICLINGIDSYAVLLVCAFVRALGQGVQTPTVSAFIPEIIPEKHLTRINGFQSGIQSFITFASPMLGGALMTFAPLEYLFFLDVFTAAIGVSIVFFFVKVPAKKITEAKIVKSEKIEYFSDFKEGLKYIRRNKFILKLIIFFAIYLFLFSPAGLLTPLQVVRNFGEDVWRLSAIEIAFSLGMMAGGLLIGMWGGFKNHVFSMTISCVLCGILSVGLGLVPNFWLYLCIMVTIGVTMPLFNTPAMVILQSTVEPSFMGRVISVFTMVSSSVMPLAMLIFGPLADVISIDILLIITGLLVIFMSVQLNKLKIEDYKQK